jgi:hypothetical protein
MSVLISIFIIYFMNNSNLSKTIERIKVKKLQLNIRHINSIQIRLQLIQ